jgi:hypothetical protein
MGWISIALGGYFFNAVTAILDKYILSSRIPQPSVNAFLVALLSLFALVLLPFGVRPMEVGHMAAAFVSGAFFIYHLMPFYAAVKSSEVSRVAPLIGALVALWLLPVSLIGNGIGGREWIGNGAGLLAFALLLGGGLLIAFRFPIRKKLFFEGFSHALLASVFLAASLALLKYVYAGEGFMNGFFWSRLGSFIGGLTFLLVPSYRKSIEKSLHFSASKKKSLVTAGALLANKTAATLGAVLVSYAVFLGPLLFVQALGGVQFAFVFLLGVGLSRRYPSIYNETMGVREWMQKIAAIVLIAAGIAMVSFV